LVQSQVKFNKVPVKVLGSLRFNRVPEKVPGNRRRFRKVREALVQSQVPEKVPGDFGTGFAVI
jgi:hypothetical protein